MIADFCNKIGPKQTWVSALQMSAFGGIADIPISSADVRYWG
jgi:hypothetical protein